MTEPLSFSRSRVGSKTVTFAMVSSDLLWKGRNVIGTGENYHKDSKTPIVNYGFYHEATNTWYGPIDQNLRKSKDWKTYQFIHIPTHPGKWKLYVQLNGWGNFGNQLKVSFDDFSVRPIK